LSGNRTNVVSGETIFLLIVEVFEHEWYVGQLAQFF
jgi:hypothetical protein